MPVFINVVIVESHQHVLEHIHSVLRKKKILTKTWTMVHFDAHPDLACPEVPAIACFTPRHALQIDEQEEDDEEGKNLYELLDATSSGIAEWILPLVLAGNLRVVEWVKPSFAKQLPMGVHKYNVGAFDESIVEEHDNDKIESFMDLSDTALVRVDWEHPYYWDDDSTVASNKLLLSQSLELHVSELEATKLRFVSLEDYDRKNLWSLDVCLDYFSCLNPYLADIDQVNPLLTDALVNAMQHMRLHATVEHQSTATSRSHYLKDLKQFRCLLEKYLTTSSQQDAKSNSALLNELSTYYESSDVGKKSLMTLKDLVTASEIADALSHVVDAIPCWNMPHLRPDHGLIVEKAIEESLSDMESALKNYDTDPFIITIARSSDDGFTPKDNVEDIQDKVLQMLHSKFCNSVNCADDPSSCCLHITRDYGEWEGSTIYPEY